MKAFLKSFRMPRGVTIKSRSSSITNAFVNGIIPAIPPSENEIKETLTRLQIEPGDPLCVYCGDSATEWDHLRPLVENRRPTGYISEIRNLVPACGKCNQSKGNKDWEEWMRGTAARSPATRGISDLEARIKRIRKFVAWGKVKKLNLESLVSSDLLNKHWGNLAKFDKFASEAQLVSDEIKASIEKKYLNRQSKSGR